MTYRQQHYRLLRIASIAAIMLLVLCAAPSAAISVTGSKYTGSIVPGGTATHTITVTTEPGEPSADILVETEGFGQGLSGIYTPLDPASDKNPYSAATGISLDKSKIHLEPGTSQTVTATIKVPQNAGAGGRYAIIYLHSLAGTAANIQTAVIIPVFITVSGTTPSETGSITKVDTGTVTIGQPIAITTSFKNTGNYHYYSAVNEVTVTDSKGTIIGKSSGDPMSYAIIPGNTVQFVTQPDLKNLQAGTYTVDSKVLLSGKVLDDKTTTLTVKANYVPPVTESNVTVSPNSAATLKSPDGRYSISFPQGAVTDAVVVTLKPSPKNQLPPAPSGAKLGATSFEIKGLAGLLGKDATVKVTYSADDLTAAGGDVSLLKLAYYNAAQSRWIILPTQTNTQDMTLTAVTNHLSVWAVMISSTTTEESTPAAATAGSPLPTTLIIGIITGIVIIIIAVFVLGKVRRRT